MAQNTLKTVPAATVTQLTDADATNVTFQNAGGHTLWIAGTADETPPTWGAAGGWVKYPPGTGERNVALTELFPGVSGCDRLWAYSKVPGSVVISHA